MNFGEVRHHPVHVFLWQLFQDGLQGDFLLISRLRLRLDFMVLLQHGAADVIVQRLQICWRACMGLLLLLDEPGTVCLVLRDARTLRSGGCLG